MSFLFPFFNLLDLFSSPFFYFLIEFDVMTGRRLNDPGIMVRFQTLLFSLFQMLQTGPTADHFSRGTMKTVAKTTTTDSVPRLRMRGVLHQSVIHFHCVMLNYKQGPLSFHPFLLALFTLSVSILLLSRGT